MNNMTQWHTRILVVALVAAFAAPTAASSDPTSTTDKVETDLLTLTTSLNEPTVLTSNLAIDDVMGCNGGTGCGSCSASCAEGQSGDCTCKGTDKKCGTWPFQKEVYECSCKCVTPQDPPPPPEFCVRAGGQKVCIESPTGEDESVDLDADPFEDLIPFPEELDPPEEQFAMATA